MKKIIYIAILILTCTCAIEDPTACFEQGGEIQEKIVPLDNFDRVIVREGVRLEIVQGSENNALIRHRENFMDDISLKVEANRLIIENNSGCNFINGFEPAKITLQAVNITELRNASQYTISNIDTLRYNSLTLISEDFNEKEVNVGDFNLIVNNQNLSIVSNDASNFFITGSTFDLNILFASGQGKLEAEDLKASNITLFHRGTNDLWVHPIQEIKGEIRGTGNVISVNRPPIVDVQALYTGSLIFSN